VAKQTTFTEYLTRPNGTESLAAEAERKSRRAAEAFDALQNAKRARRDAAKAMFDGPGRPLRPEGASAYVVASARKNTKYAEYTDATIQERRANAAVRDAVTGRREAARLFDPQSEETVLDYATTAYPSARGAKMGLQCPIFNVRVRSSDADVVAYAIRNDGTMMGKVRAEKYDSYLSVAWSSLLEGGENLTGSRATDFRRCGVGPRLYEAVAEYACKNDLTMTSDRTLYPNSRAFWERQREKGRAEYDEKARRFVVIDACAVRQTGMNGIRKKRRRSKRR